MIYEGDKNGNKVPDRHEITIHNLTGDGDFRSRESINIIEQSDIIVTNPPFTLFQDYIKLLLEHNKKFIVLGPHQALSNRDIFPLFRDNRIWFGKTIQSGDREFQIPDNYPQNAINSRTDENGLRFIRVSAIRWFTNIEFNERYEDLVLFKRYNSSEFPKYDNYDAINVS